MGRLAQARVAAPPFVKPTPIRITAPPPVEKPAPDPPQTLKPPEPRPIEDVRLTLDLIEPPQAPGPSAALPFELGPGHGDPFTIRPLGPRGATPESSDRSAIPLVRIEAKYPALAIERGLEGWVVLRFVVAADGSVRDAVVARSSHSLFEREALRAVERFRYQPQIEAGVAVESAQEILLRFSLPEGSGGASPES
jgi:protein TonB